MGIFPLSFDPSPGTASFGELRERCKKGAPENRRKPRNVSSSLLIFVRVPKEKKENKEPR